MLENLKTNTCISEIMIFVKKLQKAQYISKDVWLGFLRILAPFAPFVAEELWQNTNNYSEWKKENSVHLQPWPDYDKKYTEYKIITIPVQINGKVRSEIKIDKEAGEEEIKKVALSVKK
jgi:leucyl-tRNA synthetase